ncbi:unnamed protein product, partial [marine sediment metagenome]
ARMVVAHGESIVESIEPGTNLEAVKSEYIDLLAHPGIFFQAGTQTHSFLHI